MLVLAECETHDVRPCGCQFTKRWQLTLQKRRADRSHNAGDTITRTDCCFHGVWNSSLLLSVVPHISSFPQPTQLVLQSTGCDMESAKFNASVYPPSFAFTPRTPQKHLADSLPQCSHNETWSPVPGSLCIPALAVKRRGKADNRGLLSQIEWQMDLAMAQ